ncbi:MAG: hypothetical protein HWN66_16430 [Candidatus Helarchaeota archaeon]|nr:hypothetical protein [Candidatus Helarchaeota archaeon]
MSRRYSGRSVLIGSLGAAIAFTIVGVIGVIFALTPVDFIGLSAWGIYMFIPAFFIWLGAIGTYFRQKRLKREVVLGLESYKGGGPTSLDPLALELMMDRDSLMRILLDLRADGQARFRIDSKTGQVTIE